ncbi:MAG TPA: hypothetical protein VE129_19320 [Thermoanaerobaculia bacterium]|nr:hypothetical protein [Thermoanaerobaculia bacterium]
MPNETYPIQFDRAGTQSLLGVLARTLAFVEVRVGEMTTGTIEARIEGRPLPRPIPDPGPYFMSGCHPRIFIDWGDGPASKAFEEVALYLKALLVALEERDVIPTRLSELPGVLGPEA